MCKNVLNASIDDNVQSTVGQSRLVTRNRPTLVFFLNWLSDGNGIFHITGKLGSGKSTLMKFLCDHERTKLEFEKWAGKPSLAHPLY